mgnify:CR=1 FL=1
MVGPPGSGKTTFGTLLAERIGNGGAAQIAEPRIGRLGTAVAGTVVNSGGTVALDGGITVNGVEVMNTDALGQCCGNHTSAPFQLVAFALYYPHDQRACSPPG